MKTTAGLEEMTISIRIGHATIAGAVIVMTETTDHVAAVEAALVKRILAVVNRALEVAVRHLPERSVVGTAHAPALEEVVVFATELHHAAVTAHALGVQKISIDTSQAAVVVAAVAAMSVVLENATIVELVNETIVVLANAMIVVPASAMIAVIVSATTAGPASVMIAVTV